MHLAVIIEKGLLWQRHLMMGLPKSGLNQGPSGSQCYVCLRALKCLTVAFSLGGGRALVMSHEAFVQNLLETSTVTTAVQVILATLMPRVRALDQQPLCFP